MNEDLDEYLKKQRDIKDEQNAVIKRYSTFVKRQLALLMVVLGLTVSLVIYELIGLFKTLPVFLSFDSYIATSLILSLSSILIGEIMRRRFNAKRAMFHVELQAISREYCERIPGLPLFTKGELPE